MQIVLSDANACDFLRARGFLSPGDEAVVEPAGEGNINWVRRVRKCGHAAGRAASWILKQARPTLERFPEYHVSTERIVFEARFYETVAPFDRGGVRPQVLLFDPDARVLVLEDLRGAERLDAALARGADVRPALRALAAFAGAVHEHCPSSRALRERFANDEMRSLHGDHIFRLPYRENDFPLSPRVRARAREVWEDLELVARIDAAHARYLTPEGALVHADIQPTNVLLTPSGPRLLDAEIAHVGDPAFDLGSLFAHLLLGALGRRRPGSARPELEAGWSAYAGARLEGGSPAFASVMRYAGIEILRRTLGAARVPAACDDDIALEAISLGRRLVLDPPQALARL